MTADSPGWFLGGDTPGETAAEPADAQAPAAAPRAARGRTRIVPRALRQIVSMVTAESLGVAANQVGVELGDDHGRLALTVSTSIRVVSLQRVTSEPALIARTGGTILARSAQSQTDIRRRVGELTGADIGTVTVHLTGVDVTRERRVR
ncbi:hypothetical protein [Cryobacterium aureum]|uniref:hypothetical protein n=1 Tax=Cryobacterium aureum TaxID=995037 RepID=UPI00101ADF55|nr:hypothetical protein [Cryobacterium aureum]